MTTLHNEIDQLFDFAFGQLLGSESGNLEAWAPAVDLYDDKDVVTVKAEVPGMKKEDFQINLQDGFLTISGERKNEQQAESGASYRTERFVGRFQRSISLPGEVDPEKIKATYTDGILTVTLPKSEKAKPKQIPISVN